MGNDSVELNSDALLPAPLPPAKCKSPLTRTSASAGFVFLVTQACNSLAISLTCAALTPRRLPALAAATAATTAAATTTAAAIAATATTAAAATAAFALGTCLVDGDRTTVDLRAVQCFNRGTCFAVVIHRHKRKSPGPAGVTIRDHCHFFHLTVSSKLG